MARSPKYLIAVDTGGTFTDFFILGPHGIRTHKVLSTPKDPSLAIRQGLKSLALTDPYLMVHGSTVGTNAFLERKGARVTLVTTGGFEDVLEIGRQNRPSLYDFFTERIPPLVPRNRRLGIEERIDTYGKILNKISHNDLKTLVTRVKKSKPQSIAICLLFAYANPAHEKKIAQALRPLKIPLTLSSEICPEYREYERSSTACINAYVSPIMGRYLKKLEKKIPAKIRIMQSNGGSLSIQEASRDAAHTLLSGPAGGVLGAFQLAKRAGYPKVISLDMGGTSTDLSLMDGTIELTSEAHLGGLPLKTPMIRIDTIGAGGGSLAWVDQGGALRVGPQSAGADPGPICYGSGGKQMTITDAHVYLGRIPPRHFLGGKMELLPTRMDRPLKKLAHQLKLSPLETADGILRVANANMARALRVLSLERGYDPRDFTLVPFGGAGALHACELATMLGIPRVLVPAHPGTLSAQGMAFADWVRDYVQTQLLLESDAKPSRLKKFFNFLKNKAYQEARREGIPRTKIRFVLEMDVRYRGQSFELKVPYSANWKRDFERAHRRRYGFLHGKTPIEIVNLRLQARAEVFKTPRGTEKQHKIKKPKATPLEEMKLYWAGKNYRAKLWDRAQLVTGQKLRGPAVIAEYSATTFIPPGWEVAVERNKNLFLKN